MKKIENENNWKDYKIKIIERLKNENGWKGKKINVVEKITK